MHTAIRRAERFAQSLSLKVPVLLAPMAGACPASLSIAVARAGGLGACGALMMTPEQILAWAAELREATDGGFQMNIWIPDPQAVRDLDHEGRVCDFLQQWLEESSVPLTQGAASRADKTAGTVAERQPVVLSPDMFAEQCAAMLEAEPVAMSSIMGLYPPAVVDSMKQRGIRWFATATTVAEAVQAADAGADVIVAQGMEAGGHRGAFDADEAEAGLVGLLSLLPAIVDAVDLPVIATGGIADARGAAAALLLGASAVQVGTGFLRADESGIPTAWSDAIAGAAPEDTAVTRAFSGRPGRSIRNRYVRAAASADAPRPAPYPIQRELTKSVRESAVASNRIDGMQAWSGQSARLARSCPAADIVDAVWTGARELLS